MTGLQYVKRCLQQDFSDRAANIIPHLERAMFELTTPTDIENELTSDFQDLLNDSVYPFLACYQAMQDAGVDIAGRYVGKIRENKPSEMQGFVIKCSNAEAGERVSESSACGI